MPAGGVINAPIAPMPPAFATATERLAGHAPAIGASRIGHRKPYRSQNLRAPSVTSLNIIDDDATSHPARAARLRRPRPGGRPALPRHAPRRSRRDLPREAVLREGLEHRNRRQRYPPEP